MKLSNSTIKALGSIITGDNHSLAPLYRSGPKLVSFFNGFGAKEEYGQGFPSRWVFAETMLESFNNSGVMNDIILAAINPAHFTPQQPVEEAVKYLNKHLISDGYVILEDTSKAESVENFVNALSNTSLSSKSTWKDLARAFKIVRMEADTSVDADNLSTLSHEFIAEQIHKCKDKLAAGDYDGAITNARALTEAVQIEIVKKARLPLPSYKGDLGVLYKRGTQKALKLDPSQADLETSLKQVLSGFNSIVSGISGISNKMGDRHSRQYKPSLHHAKLAVNAALTFCEFLLDSFEYQRELKARSVD